LSLLYPDRNLYGGNTVKHLFHLLLQEGVSNSNKIEHFDPGSLDDAKGKENLYISRDQFFRISKYLEQEPKVLRCSEVCEDGWFNKKESYIRKRLKYNRKEGKYQLGISNLYRSFNGKRISRYLLYWLYDRDIYYINMGLPLEPSGEMVPTDALPHLYRIIETDKEELSRKG